MAGFNLSPERAIELAQRQRELHDILPELDKLEQCGVDCTAPHEILRDAQNKIAKLLEFYGPNAK